MVKNCNCKTFFDKSEIHQECTLTDVINCKQFLLDLKNQKPDEKTCPQLCKEVKYSAKITYSDFSMTGLLQKFTNNFKSALDEMRMHLAPAIEAKTSADLLIDDNIIILEIYYIDFDDRYSNEEKKTTFISLVSDLSAVWSIWAGFSILSLLNVGFICVKILLNFLKMTTKLLSVIQRQTRSFYIPKKKRLKEY